MSMIGRPRAPRRRYRSVHRGYYKTRNKNMPVVGEESAGGIIVKVEDGIGYAAVIARRNRHNKIEWCLPKGHIELGEHIHDTAVREVFEETGIRGRVLAPLATIDYWFSGSGRYVHKVVHHFLLQAIGGEIGVDNDPDQEAESAAWIPLDELNDLLVYPNERKVVARALALLHDNEGD